MPVTVKSKPGSAAKKDTKSNGKTSSVAETKEPATVVVLVKEEEPVVKLGDVKKLLQDEFKQFEPKKKQNSDQKEEYKVAANNARKIDLKAVMRAAEQEISSVL